MSSYIEELQISPDCTVLLSRNNENCVALYQIYPSENVDSDEITCINDKPTPFHSHLFQEYIYDMAWYPYMTYQEPATNCYLLSTRNNPLKLIDTFSANTRATYMTKNHLDEVIPANSVVFSQDGRSVWAGFRHFLTRFDTGIDGDTGYRIDAKGIGILSCLKNWNENTLIGGTFSNWITILQNDKVQSTFEASAAVTHMETHENYLVVGYRKYDYIDIFDIRYLDSTVARLRRESMTNQRMHFSVYSGHVITGNTDGRVHVYDMKTIQDGDSKDLDTPQITFQAGPRSVPSVVYDSTQNIVATVSGDRNVIEEDQCVLQDQETEQINLKYWKFNLSK